MFRSRKTILALTTAALLIWGAVFALLSAAPADTTAAALPTHAAFTSSLDRHPLRVEHNNSTTVPMSASVPPQSIAADAPTPMPPNVIAAPEAAPDQVIVRFAPEATQSQRDAYIASLGATVTDESAPLNAVVVTLPDAAAQSLPPSPYVASAEPNYMATILITAPTNDWFYGNQWGLSAIGVQEAWAALPASPEEVVVAVIDTGICTDTADMSGRVLAGYDFVNNDTDPEDDNGHGCAVSGVIAANINNAFGVAGIAPNVKILPLKAMDTDGNGNYFDIADAIRTAADQGADIINLSLGGINASSILEDAVNYATARGVTLVAATGNYGVEGIMYPARYDAVIAVGSVDVDGERSYFSNTGPELDTYAPGSGVYTLWLNGAYRVLSGTSLAAPHVAGLAALGMALDRDLVLDGGIVRLEDPAPQNILSDTPQPGPIFTVNKTSDTADGTCSTTDCSLREAITAVNNYDPSVYAAPVVYLVSGTYQLSIPGTGEDANATGDLDITRKIIITGENAATTIIDANHLDRVFDVHSANANFNDLTITNGQPEPGAHGGGVRVMGLTSETRVSFWRVILLNNQTNGANGGGIYAKGVTGFRTSVSFGQGIIRGNHALNGNGGGLYMERASGGAGSSELSANTAVNGGAVWSDSTVSISRATVSGNSASESGGGIYIARDITASGAPNVSYSTIVNNTTDSDNNGTGDGGGIYNSVTAVHVSITPTILYGNVDSGGEAPDCGGKAYFDLTSLLGSQSGCVIQRPGVPSPDPLLIGVDPLLGPLQDNGGFSLTHLPATNSPILDRYPNCSVETLRDQRGYTFRDGVICDLGAVELLPYTPDDTVYPTAYVIAPLWFNNFDGYLPFTPNAEFPESSSTIGISFNQVLFNPDGNNHPNDVTNPANYLLVSAGSNNIIDTQTCATPAGDDQAVVMGTPFYGFQWDDVYFGFEYPVVRLPVNNGIPLPDGLYRLLLCDELRQVISGSALDGNFDSQPGGDAKATFGISASGSPLTQPGPIFTVNKRADTADGTCGITDCSLREAIIAANAYNGGAGGATVSIPAGMHRLSIAGAGEDNAATGDLDITAGMTITGASRDTTIIDANQIDRVLHIVGSANVTISNLTVYNGSVEADEAFGGGIYAPDAEVQLSSVAISDNLLIGESVASGGGYFGTHRVTITNSLISNNDATSNLYGYGFGGGIFTAGTTTIVDSQISANQSNGLGGGIYHAAGDLTIRAAQITNNQSILAGGINIGNAPDSIGTVRIENSQISGNVALVSGGGIFQVILETTLINTTISGNTSGDSAGILSGSGNITLINSTIWQNITTSDDPYFAAQQASFVAFDSDYDDYPPLPVQITNTIIADGGDAAPSCSIGGVPVTFSGTNLSDDASCGTALVADPLLAPLADNGGGTMTHALLPNSPALNAADETLCPTTDQRGVSRPQGLGCDIGAYESELNPPVPMPQNPVANSSGAATAAITWNSTNPNSFDQFRVERLTGDAGILSGSGWSEIAALPNYATSHTDNNLSCGTTYSYRVRAYRAADDSYSDYSDYVTITTDACDAPVTNTVGLYRNGIWQFGDQNTTGGPTLRFVYGPQEAGWQPLTGDWDGDGTDGIGLYKDGVFLLRNATDAGAQDIVFRFGDGQAGWQALSGDWNGDGVDSIGLYKNGQVILRNSNSAGGAEIGFRFTFPTAGMIAVAGDFDASGADSVGLYKDGMWLLHNSLTDTAGLRAFGFGPAQAGWLPITGDWNADGVTTVGLQRGDVWRLRESNSAGGADIGFNFGVANDTSWLPLASYRGGLSVLTVISQGLPNPLDISATPLPEATETVVAPTETPLEAAPEVTAPAEVITPPPAETTPEATPVPTDIPTAAAPPAAPEATAEATAETGG